jgi:hypothetical protein
MVCQAVKQVSEGQAPAGRGDLRMVLNLDKIVPSPYFRSYWIERNITEMKQYASAVSDLYRTPQSYREERVLVRHAGLAAKAQGDVQALSALAPEDAAFYRAQASPTRKVFSRRCAKIGWRSNRTSPRRRLGAHLRRFRQKTPAAPRNWMFPLIVPRLSSSRPMPFNPCERCSACSKPDAQLEVYATRALRSGVLVSLQTAMVLTAPQDWDEDSVVQALSSALLPGLTAGKLGVHWETRSRWPESTLPSMVLCPSLFRWTTNNCCSPTTASCWRRCWLRSRSPDRRQAKTA